MASAVPENPAPMIATARGGRGIRGSGAVDGEALTAPWLLACMRRSIGSCAVTGSIARRSENGYEAK